MDICHIEPIVETELDELLLTCLNKLSSPDGYSPDIESASQGNHFSIDLGSVRLTPTVVSLLVQLLDQPLPKTCTSSDTASKWDYLSFFDCHFETRTTISHYLQTLGAPNSGHCTREDMHSLINALVRRTKHLSLHNSTQLFALLTRIPQLDQLQLTSLFIHEHSSSHIFDYAPLGEMIRRSTHLVELHLVLPFQDFPRETFESLSNAVNIQELCLRQLYRETYGALEQITSDLVGDETCNGVVVRLLQNPQSQLHRLDLQRMRLEDRHFIAIAQALPTSRLKSLNVANNNIQSEGILEFARQLPRITSLKTIVLLPNPWLPYGQSSVQSETCGAELVKGMMENCSIEQVTHWCGEDPSTVEEYPQADLLMHLGDLNRAGRHILTTSPSIPLGLWAHVLHRAGTTLVYPPGDRLTRSSDLEPLQECVQQPAKRANAVYFLLQNSPLFFDVSLDAKQRNTWR